MKKENNDEYVIHASVDQERAELLKLECSNCGASLELLDRTHARCPYCQQEYRIDEAKGTAVSVSVDYGDSEKVQQTLHATKRTMMVFLGIVIFIVVIILGINIAANSSAFSSSDRDRAVEEEGNLLVIFCKDIFGKEFQDITEEELASIRYIRYDYDREVNDGFHVIEYSFTNYEDCQDEEEFQDTIQYWTYFGTMACWPSDFTMLTGLTRVNTCDSVWMSSLEFSKDAGISYVDTDNQLEVVTSRLDPEDIRVLHIGIQADDLEGIEAYRNLEELVIDYSAGRGNLDISGIGKCTGLKRLVLDCADTYTGLEELEELHELESIYISGLELKDCDFLQGMTELEELSVNCGESGDLSVLFGLPKLKRLYFMDHEPIDTGSLQMLSQLEALKLTVYEAESLQGLKALTNLKSLDLYLMISGGSWRNATDVSVLSELPCLEELILEDFYDGEITGLEGVLNNPSMKRVLLGDDMSISLSMCVILAPELLTDNPGLESLKMVGWKTSADSSTMEQSYDILAHYPNLKKLGMAKCELSDLDFMASLLNLEILDLQGNELTDYTPLLSCKKLKMVYVYDNPQTETGLPENVRIITEWEPDGQELVR